MELVNLRYVGMLLIGAVVLGSLVSCDPAYPPVIHNDAQRPVSLTFELNDGRGQHEVPLLAASSHFGFLGEDKGYKLIRLIIKYENGPKHDLDEEALNRIRQERSNTEFEVWVVSEGGVKLISKKEWHQLIRRGTGRASGE